MSCTGSRMNSMAQSPVRRQVSITAFAVLVTPFSAITTRSRSSIRRSGGALSSTPVRHATDSGLLSSASVERCSCGTRISKNSFLMLASMLWSSIQWVFEVEALDGRTSGWKSCVCPVPTNSSSSFFSSCSAAFCRFARCLGERRSPSEGAAQACWPCSVEACLLELARASSRWRSRGCQHSDLKPHLRHIRSMCDLRSGVTSRSRSALARRNNC
mmetsp:Transcript_4227/g.15180  ORF Transcript_4227/g.15180 Transcript_4227/m.15180 type:complete len:215 (+) Transcript_4227:741-1385(+)